MIVAERPKSQKARERGNGGGLRGNGKELRADWILTDARIWTGTGGPSRAGELAMSGGRILAVGGPGELDGLRGPDTAILHLEGRCILPGFVDAHVHLQAGGLQLFRVDLRGAASPEAFVQQVTNHARLDPEGSWILGGDWDHQLWGGGLPTREWLDRAAPGRPVFLHRTDMHMGVASSRALELAGVTAETPNPENGFIDRDPETGEPTGVLRERAMETMSRVVPPPTTEERRAAIQAAVIHALGRGVTQLHDMGALQSSDESWRSLHTLQALYREGRLPMRVAAAVPISDREELARYIAEEGRGDARLRWGAAKGFVDGSLGSSTAWFHDEYRGQPEHRGAPACMPEELERQILETADLGLQPIVHAIGDRATDWLLGVYEEVERRHPGADLRPRMEHAQHMTREGIQTAGRLGAICSAQPLHLLDDGRWAGDLLGEDRAELSYPFRSLKEAGATLAFGSDWTVAPIDPVGTLEAAVTRRVWNPATAQWGDPWVPGERISLEAALMAQTLDASRAAFLETHTGSLEVGKQADLAILSADPFQVDPEAFREELHVEMTFVDGVLVYRAEDPLVGGTE